MLAVQNITKPNKPDDLYKIQFFFTRGRYNQYTLQNIITYDIETSTVYRKKGTNEAIGFDHELYNSDEEYKKMIDEAEPLSIMYHWQFAIESADGHIYVFTGRDWSECYEFIMKLNYEIKRQICFGVNSVNRDAETMAALASNTPLKSIWWIQNAGFEFQHLRNLFENDFYATSRKQKVFARSPRKPMKVNFSLGAGLGVEIRDSYVLTQKSLSNWCKDEQLPVMKCDPIDYLKIRTPETPLTQEEIQYCINDVVSMVYGIWKYRDKFGTIENIPLTQTGIVRRKVCTTTFEEDYQWCKDQCNIMKKYTYGFFSTLCKLFQGGWTHANAKMVDTIHHNVRAFDFASSYPAVMTTALFPTGEFELTHTGYFDKYSKQDVHGNGRRWFAKVKFKSLVSVKQNTYWSLSKCEEIEGLPMVDNGRVVSCYSLTCWLTDLDYDIMRQAYVWSEVECLELYTAKSGYLSTSLIRLILGYFGYKTSLKGTDNLSLYTESKQFINSIYGCFVTRIVSDEIEFQANDEGWHKESCSEETFYETMDQLKPDKCFGSFQLGIWVTAWARHRLWDFILHFDEKIIYCDTDSIKGLFDDEDLKWIEEYNNKIADLEANVASKLGISEDLYTPITSKGKMKRLGIMEREDDAVRFKTLGAKRYAYETEDGAVHTTIAGLPKGAGTKKLKSIDDFTNKTVWNTKESNKNTAVYNDNQTWCDVVDMYGNTYTATDKYGVAIVPTTFDMTIGEEFEKFLKVLITGTIDEDDEFFSDVPVQFR